MGRYCGVLPIWNRKSVFTMSPNAIEYLQAWEKLYNNLINVDSILYDIHLDNMENLWHSLSEEDIKEVENRTHLLQKVAK